jgi:pyrroline-5-carboxylate reductase
MDEKKIGFFGFGHMAQVLFGAIDRAKLIPRSRVFFMRRDVAKSLRNELEFGITATSLAHIAQHCDVIFLCVKPQQAAQAIDQLKEFSLDGKLVISILAGTTLGFLEANLTGAVQVIRAMPNIASEVGEGMTILTYGVNCDEKHKRIAHRFFGSVGQISSLPESLMDVAASMAGCGPGFVLRMIAAMAQAGKKQGMDEQEALKIAAQTFMGAAKLVANGSIPAELIRQIATPQGMTAAGLISMDQTNIDGHFIQAIEAALNRAKELSSS